VSKLPDMFSLLSDRQRRFIDAIREMGPAFQRRAFANDAEGAFPVENYADLKRANFPALAIPTALGGMGGSYLDYALLSAELARWCPATALTFNMHLTTTLWSGAVANDLGLPDDELRRHQTRRDRFFTEIVEKGVIFAQPFSEPNNAAAAGKAPFGVVATRVDGGFRVNGIKHFASLAGYADYYAVVCTEEVIAGIYDTKNTILLAVPAKTEGVRIFGEWEVLGMRATDSRSLELKEAFVPAENLLMPPGAYYSAALRWPHMFFTLTPCYVGLAQAAFDFTVAYLRGEAAGSPPAGEARRSAGKQTSVATMRIKLEQAKALWWQTVNEARVDPSREERLRAYAAQYTVMEHANEIASLALRACGGRSILRNFAIERLYRDSRCGSLMLPWTAEICVERLGRESLFEPGET
jgi:alkylation response protein AidB-like acyl-CoA dehydrogenase